MKLINDPCRRKVFALIISILLVCAVATCFSSQAKTQARMDINITGTVVATGSCTFNQGGTIKVDFGIVKYMTTSGSNALEGTYRQRLSSGMHCSGDTASSTSMTFRSVDGDNVDYQGNKLLAIMDDHSGLKSSDMAIRLLVNQQPQDINTKFIVDMQNPPQLEVDVVQIGSGSSFVSGATFSASATLTMEFD